MIRGLPILPWSKIHNLGPSFSGSVRNSVPFEATVISVRVLSGTSGYVLNGDETVTVDETNGIYIDVQDGWIDMTSDRKKFLAVSEGLEVQVVERPRFEETS